MARGWESKNVEAQMEEGKERPRDDAKPTASGEARLRQERLESLRLSRSRMLQQLERAVHPSHRAVLMKGLKAIEQELEGLNA